MFGLTVPAYPGAKLTRTLISTTRHSGVRGAPTSTAPNNQTVTRTVGRGADETRQQLRRRIEPRARDLRLVTAFLIQPRPAWRNGEMSILPCSKCSGEGSLYASRYGGNDPDVWRAGECDACSGSGNEVCSSRGCDEPAVAFNDDGDALCEDCLSEWTIAGNESEGHYP